MKLVQLLAKELKEWPEGISCMIQDGSGKICTCRNGFPDPYDGDWTICGPKSMCTPVYWANIGSNKHELAIDQASAIITKEQWQAEREKMNKPKWIRHRGGKCPVKAGTKVVTRYRDGVVSDWCMTRNQDTDEECLSAIWSHSGGETDIMAYYVEETKDQEIEEVIPKHMAFGYASKEEMVAQIGEECPFAQVASTAEKTNFGTITYKLEIDATEATKEIDSLVAKWGQIESPLKWRDEIIELEAYEEEFRREREKLIRKLESEGFKLIDHMAPVYGEQIIDMSDWRNWQAGDVIEIVANEGAHEFENGEEVIVVFLDLNDTDMNVKAEYKDRSDYWWLSGKDAKFIRRP